MWVSGFQIKLFFITLNKACKNVKYGLLIYQSYGNHYGKYYKEKEYHLVALIPENKSKDGFGKHLLHYSAEGKNENGICHIASIITVCKLFYPFSCLSFRPQGDTDSLTCLVYTQERNNLSLMDSYILCAADFCCVPCCWREQGWNFDGEWATVYKVQKQPPFFSVHLRIKRLLFLLSIWRQSTLCEN